MTQLLSGKTALVTGAAGLLGFEHTKALLSSGCNVILTDYDISNLENRLIEIKPMIGEQKILVVEADLSRKDSILQMSQVIKDSDFTIDILINNAAVNPTISDSTTEGGNSFETFALERWNYEISVNLTGSFLCCQIFGSDMAMRKSGVILNIASDLSVIAPDNRIYSVSETQIDHSKAKPVSYSVSKTAIVGLTRYLAEYWAKDGVRVNCISPGGVRVDQPKDFVEKIERLIPMGRMANVDEYRGVVLFLVSDASSYMTGQNIVVDGGRSII